MKNNMECPNIIPDSKCECHCRPVNIRERIIFIGDVPKDVIDKLNSENKEVIIYSTIADFFKSIKNGKAT